MRAYVGVVTVRSAGFRLGLASASANAEVICVVFRLVEDQEIGEIFHVNLEEGDIDAAFHGLASGVGFHTCGMIKYISNCTRYDAR